MSISAASLGLAKGSNEPHRLTAGRRPRKTVPFRSPASRSVSSVEAAPGESKPSSTSRSSAAAGSSSSTQGSSALAPVVITSHPSFLFALPDKAGSSSSSSSSDKEAVTPPEELAISPALHSLIFALCNDRYPGAPGTSLHKAHQEALKAEAAAKREAAKLLAARKEWERLGINGLGKKRKSSSPYASGAASGAAVSGSGLVGFAGTVAVGAEQPSDRTTSAKRSRTAAAAAGAIDHDALPVPQSANGSSSNGGSRSRKPASRGASPVPPASASATPRNASPDSVSGRSTRARRNGADAAASSAATTPAPGAGGLGTSEGGSGGSGANGSSGNGTASTTNGVQSHLNGHAPIPVHSSPLARNAAVTVNEVDSK